MRRALGTASIKISLAFAVEFGGEQTDAGDVAAGTRERCHQSLSDHIFGHADERDRPGDGLKGAQGGRRAGDDRIGRGTNQSCRAIREIIVSRFEAARNDSEVFSLDKAVQPQFIEERLDHRCLPRRGQQKPETIGASRLLPARRKRPRRRNTEQRYELAASHCPMPSVLPTEGIAHLFGGMASGSRERGRLRRAFNDFRRRTGSRREHGLDGLDGLLDLLVAHRLDAPAVLELHLARHQKRKNLEVRGWLLPRDLLNCLLAVLAEMQQQRLHEFLVQQMTRAVPVAVGSCISR